MRIVSKHGNDLTTLGFLDDAAAILFERGRAEIVERGAVVATLIAQPPLDGEAISLVEGDASRLTEIPEYRSAVRHAA